MSATHAYIRANYALARVAVARIPISEARIQDFNRKLAAQCPQAGRGTPINEASQPMSYEVAVALWSLAILGIRLTAAQAFGVLLSMCGVLIILLHGDFTTLSNIDFNKGDLIFVVALITYLIGVGSFPHIVAGSVESFFLVANGQLGLGPMLGGFTLPVLLGNIVGGNALFAVLSYAQVMKEI